MIIPIIVPRIAASGSGAMSPQDFADALAFGYVGALKIGVLLVLACIPLGAIYGWIDDRSVGSIAIYSALLPLTAVTVWVTFGMVAHALFWAVS